MEVVERKGLGEIAVDRQWRLYVDEQITRTWSPRELGSMFVHHVEHLLRDHGSRGDRVISHRDGDRSRWTLAADLEINDDLDDDRLSFREPLVTPTSLGLPSGDVAEHY